MFRVRNPAFLFTSVVVITVLLYRNSCFGHIYSSIKTSIKSIFLKYVQSEWHTYRKNVKCDVSVYSSPIQKILAKAIAMTSDIHQIVYGTVQCHIVYVSVSKLLITIWVTNGRKLLIKDKTFKECLHSVDVSLSVLQSVPMWKRWMHL